MYYFNILIMFHSPIETWKSAEISQYSRSLFVDPCPDRIYTIHEVILLESCALLYYGRGAKISSSLSDIHK